MGSAVRDLVVIGGSAGGIQAVSTLLGDLPVDLPAAVVVVLHRAADSSSNGLEPVLARASALPVSMAGHGELIEPGRVYVAGPGQHLLVNRDRLVLATTARVNRVRPAVDPLFRSAARWFGPRVIGVVVTGALDDGAAGLAAIHALGGVCLVQDPGEARFDGMPTSALAAVPAAKALSIRTMGAALAELAGQPAGSTAEEPPTDLVVETELAEHGRRPIGVDPPGEPTPIACPECRGGMTLVRLGGAVHYQCHVGHSYGPWSLMAAQSEGAETALWTAVSILEEQELIRRSMAEASRGEPQELHLAAAERAAAAAEAVRAMLVGSGGSGTSA